MAAAASTPLVRSRLAGRDRPRQRPAGRQPRASSRTGRRDLVPAQPLFQLGAMTQGQLGSLICLALRGHAAPSRRGRGRVVTHVRVDPDDPAFDDADQADRAVPRRGEARAGAAEQRLGGASRTPAAATAASCPRRGRWRSSRAPAVGALARAPARRGRRGRGRRPGRARRRARRRRRRRRSTRTTPPRAGHRRWTPTRCPADRRRRRAARLRHAAAAPVARG